MFSLESIGQSFSGLPLALAREGTLWMPRQGSTDAAGVDQMFYWILYICVFFLALITFGTIWFCWQYRFRPGVEPVKTPDHNHTIEVIWTVIPLIIVIWMFWVGFEGYSDLITPPSDSYEIQTLGRKWQWEFQYPTGAAVYPDEETNMTPLRVPAGQNVSLIMSSADVLHAMFVPDFRIKQDVVPGRYTKVWFNAPEPGEHPIFCAEYCGEKHSRMRGMVYVMPPEEFQLWLDKYDPTAGMDPVEAGEFWYSAKGCKQCHSLDGTPGTAPTFKGMFGHEVKLANGTTVTVDENYVRESILDPQSKIVEGFAPVMPTFKGNLKEENILQIIAFLKEQAK